MTKHESAAGKLHHIEIYVSDLKKSCVFWGWFLGQLGYEEYQQWDQGVSWRLGETYLVFVQTEEKYLDQPYHRCRVGLNHLAFHAGSQKKIEELRSKLKSRGVTVLYEDRPAQDKFYFEDPDRIKVELVFK